MLGWQGQGRGVLGRLGTLGDEGDIVVRFYRVSLGFLVFWMTENGEGDEMRSFWEGVFCVVSPVSESGDG